MVSSERFREAFRRFERVVDIGRFSNVFQLELAFGRWAGDKYHGTRKQKYALAEEAEEHNMQVPLSFFSRSKEVGWKIRETKNVNTDSFMRHGKTVYIFRDAETGKFVSGKPDDESKE